MENMLNSHEQIKTILVVDGHQMVRELLAAVLNHGDCYNVLTAESSADGLEQSRNFKGELHLLITDFQLSEVSGIELATAMTAERPKLRVLLVSDFPDGMLVLNDGWHFLPKPFIASQMRTLVKAILSPSQESRFAVPSVDRDAVISG